MSSSTSPQVGRAKLEAALIACILVIVLFFAAGAVRAALPQSGSSPETAGASRTRVIEIRIGDEIEPVEAEYIDNGIEEAARQHAGLVLITMDTPGGLEDSMQLIIQHILSSPVPVAVYVWPAGRRGASAGFFILMSADIAAMAPGTHAGAASPLMAMGGVPLNIDETLKKKILNDATAYLRSYAGKRGRNVALAETAVTDGKAFTDKEALDGRLIDLIVDSPEQLLATLDGRVITRFDGSTTKLDLRNPDIVTLEKSARQRFLSRIVQPDVFFILLIAGVLGLYVEFTHPGVALPGVIGAICLVLALFAMHILPVNFAGLLLIVVALGLFVLEAKYTSHGALAVGGIVAMILGALLLIRSPMTGAGVSLGAALGVTVPAAAVTIFLMRLVLRTRGWKQTTGAERLVGEEAEVIDAIKPVAGLLLEPSEMEQSRGPYQGMVRLQGELWRAEAPEAVPVGTRVRVLRIAGLTAYVAPVTHTIRMAGHTTAPQS